MIKLSMPYDIQKGELSGELKSIGFEPLNYMTKKALSRLKILLVLRDGYLDEIKNREGAISHDRQFQVIEIYEGTRDVSDEIESEYVILSFVPKYDWGIGDNLEPFEPKKGDSYLTIVPIDDLKEMDIFWMCLELSYRFGTKFKFYTVENENVCYISLSKECISRKSILDTIVKNKSSIENTYGVKIDVTRSHKGKEKEDFDF